MHQAMRLKKVLGDSGERKAVQIIEKHFPQLPVLRVAQKLRQQRMGYDFSAQTPSGKTIKLFEVKTDFHQSQNMALEVYHKRDDGVIVPGWFHSSKADHLIYLRPAMGDYLLMDMAMLRYMLQDLRIYRVIRVKNPDYITYCKLIPVDDLVSMGFHLHQLEALNG